MEAVCAGCGSRTLRKKREHDDHYAFTRRGVWLGARRRAAEQFARRVARDAAKFAERMEEHAGDFARDVSRGRRRAMRACHAGPEAARGAWEPEVKRILESIRTLIADVLEGVDDLIETIFAAPAASPDDTWVRLVLNREVTCTGCARTVAAGEEGHMRRNEAAMEFRCLECGEPAAPNA